MLFKLVAGGFSYLINQNNQNSNQKKSLGFRNMQEKLENTILCTFKFWHLPLFLRILMPIIFTAMYYESSFELYEIISFVKSCLRFSSKLIHFCLSILYAGFENNSKIKQQPKQNNQIINFTKIAFKFITLHFYSTLIILILIMTA